MKNIIISMLAVFGLLFVAPTTVLASEAFNTDPGDMPTVTVSTDANPCEMGPIDGCWKTSVNAQPGDIVTVQVYFHNSTEFKAENTKIYLGPKSSGAKTSHTISGEVASTSLGRAQGSARVNISSSESLTFISGSVRLGKNGTSALYHVENESDLFGNAGVSIGTVSPGWDTQGYLVAQYRVSDNDNGDDSDECEIDRFVADDNSIDEDEETTLRWNTTNCDDVEITASNGSDLGDVSEDGSEEVSPNRTTTYTLHAYPGNHTKKVTISVDQDNNDDCEIDSFEADDTSIEKGDSTTLRWKTTGFDDVDITPGFSNKNADSSVRVSPTKTTTYTIRGSESGCSDSDTVTVYVDEQNNTRPQAITNPATLVSANSAKLNGIVIANANKSTNGWFEWGKSSSLGYTTPKQSIGSNGSLAISYAISGLSPNTTYYFRAVAQNANGTGYGEILTFRTGGATTTVTRPTTTVVRNVVTARSTASLLELRVESRYDRMCVGGELEYEVFYKNISKSNLVDTVLQVSHQKELVFIDATRGDYSASEKTLTIGIGDLKAGEEGSVRIRGRVVTGAQIGELVVTTAQVVYTNPTTRAQEDAIAYALTTISDECPTLGAGALFGAGSFLPDTLIEWLILILVILALIVLGRKIFNKNS